MIIQNIECEITGQHNSNRRAYTYAKIVMDGVEYTGTVNHYTDDLASIVSNASRTSGYGSFQNWDGLKCLTFQQAFKNKILSKFDSNFLEDYSISKNENEFKILIDRCRVAEAEIINGLTNLISIDDVINVRSTFLESKLVEYNTVFKNVGFIFKSSYYPYSDDTCDSPEDQYLTATYLNEAYL